jgi:very-short-patch-repair endonuclease
LEKFCKNCGKIIPEERLNNSTCTCCRSCATSLANKKRGKLKQSTKEKISKSIKKYFASGKGLKTGNYNYNKYKLISECIALGILTNYYNTQYEDRYINQNRCKINTCPICGKTYTTYLTKSGRLRDFKTCSEECKQLKLSKTSKELVQRRIQNNTFIGWQSRNISSYPETFWKKVLNNNNIEYKHNFKFDKYFLDFYIIHNGKFIDLEIDGKQHKYPDRLESDKIRDIFITKNNIIVYRIDWNEINSERGKKLMEEKINKFLDFYKNI